MTKRELAVQRLNKAHKYLELALDTRAVSYAGIPFIQAANQLIEIALDKQT